MRIGIIYCAYGTKDYLKQSLSPWIDIKTLSSFAFQTDGVSPHVSICAINVRFAGFEGEDDGTREELRGYLERGEIDHLIEGPDNIPETTARGMALRYLKDQGCDISIMVDSDEFYTIHNIGQIFEFVADNPWVQWFRVSLRNMVFDDKTWLAEPFQPPRIHRLSVEDGRYEAHSFCADNDILYGGTITRDLKPQSQFSSITIPPEVAFVRHESWPNSLRSKAKVEYQTRRWGNACSFSWDDQKGLIFNPTLPQPRVVTES